MRRAKKKNEMESARRWASRSTGFVCRLSEVSLRRWVGTLYRAGWLMRTVVLEPLCEDCLEFLLVLDDVRLLQEIARLAVFLEELGRLELEQCKGTA